jgi:DNA-binding transcriptional ArsR family regulator
MDLIRQLLLKLEALDYPPSALVTFNAHDEDIAIEGYEPDQIDYHLSLLYEAGFVVSGDPKGARMMSGDYMFQRLSWSGHEFLDAIRDPEIWKRTKGGISNIGGWTIGLVKDIAAAYAKQLAKERLGLDLG